MDNMYLGHLSRPQLVNLLLRIVDLLAQPLPQPVSGPDEFDNLRQRDSVTEKGKEADWNSSSSR